MFVSDNFDLKIADFGFAAPAAGRDGKGYPMTELGTRQFMAPEIHLGRPYSGKGVDLFSSVIILFMMLSGRPPFRVATPDDAHYKAINAANKAAYWNAHEKHTKFSDDAY